VLDTETAWLSLELDAIDLGLCEIGDGEGQTAAPPEGGALVSGELVNGSQSSLFGWGKGKMTEDWASPSCACSTSDGPILAPIRYTRLSKYDTSRPNFFNLDAFSFLSLFSKYGIVQIQLHAEWRICGLRNR
jgi:hypothetical protein